MSIQIYSPFKNLEVFVLMPVLWNFQENQKLRNFFIWNLLIFKNKTEFKRFTEIMCHLPGNSTGFSTPNLTGSLMSLPLYQGNANSNISGWDSRVIQWLRLHLPMQGMGVWSLAGVKVKSLSRVWLSATSWTAAHQAPLSMGFSRQEYWSGVPLPSP